MKQQQHKEVHMRTWVKSLITAAAIAIIVDLWRNWPWAKAVFLKAQQTVKE